MYGKQVYFTTYLCWSGPGEQGAAVILSAEEEAKKDELYKVNGFNAFVSDKISLDRALKDIRHPEYDVWQLIVCIQ